MAGVRRWVGHSIAEMLSQRIYGRALGYAAGLFERRFGQNSGKISTYSEHLLPRSRVVRIEEELAMAIATENVDGNISWHIASQATPQRPLPTLENPHGTIRRQTIDASVVATGHELKTERLVILGKRFSRTDIPQGHDRGGVPFFLARWLGNSLRIGKIHGVQVQRVSALIEEGTNPLTRNFVPSRPGTPNS